MTPSSTPDRRNGRRPSAETLRAAIDRGDAADKVAGSDPAAVPLGADDEAAGAPPTPQQVETALAEETGRTARAADPARDGAQPATRSDAAVREGEPRTRRGGFRGGTWMAVAIAAAVAVLVLLLLV